MAKQKGLHKLAGKVDEQSYYYSKNGGYQSRKINPGIGERVKTDPAYHNTRLNNTEFGAAGACAGAMVREVSLRWRYLLDSIATGKLVKIIKALMSQDATSPWGQRVVAQSDMASVQEAYTRFSKNQMPESISDYCTNHITNDTGSCAILFGGPTQYAFDIDDELSNLLASIGATGFKLSFYVLNVKAPEFSSLIHGYLPAAASLKQLKSVAVASIATGTSIVPASSVSGSYDTSNISGHFGGVLTIFEPIKSIGSVNYVLQQHCAAQWNEIDVTK